MGVTFDFPIYREHTEPSFNEGEWVAVRPIMEKLKAAKPFFRKVPDSPERGFLDLPDLYGERLAHFPGLSLEGDGALEAQR